MQKSDILSAMAHKLSEPLALRSLGSIAVGFFAAALVGSVFFAMMIIRARLAQPFPGQVPMFYTILAGLLFGTMICLIVEIVLVSPVLFALSKASRSWLKSWHVIAFGVLYGFIPGFIFSLINWGDGTFEYFGPAPEHQENV